VVVFGLWFVVCGLWLFLVYFVNFSQFTKRFFSSLQNARGAVM
jgi:hypothetical protein